MSSKAADQRDDFRTTAGPEPIAVVLGRLVEREVGRQRSAQLRDGVLDDRELVDALDRAKRVHADLATIVERLERRLGGGNRPGRATWEDEP